MLSILRMGPDSNDDLISSSVKNVVNIFVVCGLCCLLSFILVMLQLIDDGQFIPYSVLLFLPMWVGSALGLGFVIFMFTKICTSGLTLISSERRFFMQIQQKGSLESYVDYESLPLMRLFIFWSSAFAVFMTMALVTEILFFLWYIYGVIGMWHAFVPTIIMASLFITFHYMVNLVSIMECGVFTVSFIALLLFAAKCRGSDVPWFVVIVPAMVIQITWLMHLANVASNVSRGILKLSVFNWITMLCYCVSISLTLYAEGYALFLESVGELSDESGQAIIEILWLLAGSVFGCTALAVVRREMYRVADSRGYRAPAPLRKTPFGWGSEDLSTCWSMLLGTLTAGRPVHLLARKAWNPAGVAVRAPGFLALSMGGNAATERSHSEDGSKAGNASGQSVRLLEMTPLNGGGGDGAGSSGKAPNQSSSIMYGHGTFQPV